MAKIAEAIPVVPVYRGDCNRRPWVLERADTGAVIRNPGHHGRIFRWSDVHKAIDYAEARSDLKLATVL